MYGYNVYIEKGTLSPEPMLLLYLQPGETTSFTQHLKFGSIDGNGSTLFLSMILDRAFRPNHSGSFGGMFFLIACYSVAFSLYAYLSGSRRRSGQYTQIADNPIENEIPRRIATVQSGREWCMPMLILHLVFLKCEMKIRSPFCFAQIFHQSPQKIGIVEGCMQGVPPPLC